MQAAIILAAGKGTRMKSSLPKVMHRVAGRPMIRHAVRAAREAGVEQIVTVLGPEMETVKPAVTAACPDAVFAVQEEALGTAHAVLAAREALAGHEGYVAVLFGDTPLIRAETLAAALAAAEEKELAVLVIGIRPLDPTGYGRLVQDEKSGALIRIVEEKEASAEEKAIGLCNSGMMILRAPEMFGLLGEIDNQNSKGEYYLTDVVEIACRHGLSCGVIEADAAELAGVNSRAQLAQAEAAMQARLRAALLEEGVTMVAPETVFLAADTRIGRDSVLHPHVVLGPNVAIGEGVEIRSFSHIEGAVIADGAVVGPFARLRPGANLETNARVGNFVEVKKATLEKGAKVNHLSYIGDASVGEGANVGAGTITCNYDGFHKSFTEIGEGAFIGSNTALVAPVRVGPGAIVGAGSVVTDDVPAGALAVGRAKQQNLEEWAHQFRRRRKEEKKPAHSPAAHPSAPPNLKRVSGDD